MKRGTKLKGFLDLTTRGKLIAGFGLMIVFLAMETTTAYPSITAIQAAQKPLPGGFRACH